ncbi:phage major capsid protein [Gordonia sp. HY442]|uniref:phage major capsid protein n=1 Tax=Gordonia zhenghanii TaxID=2911516 RepID=UPI001F005C24|nr:phage major capsid protein [Gordonia zhenghanii]MCF8603261.1 phage major capsid protein [Gordonia zhenghanii]
MKRSEQRDELLTKARGLIAQRKESGSGLTAEDRAVLADYKARIDDLNAQITKANEDGKLLEAIKNLGAADYVPTPGEEDPIGGGKSGGGWSQTGDTRFLTGAAIKASAARLATKARPRARDEERGEHVKNVSLTNATDDLVLDPIAGMPRTPTSLWDVLPVSSVANPTVRYLRQTARDIDAKVVAPGELKPTSTLALEPVDVSLKTVATISEPIDKWSLVDVRNLQQFIGGELQYGLFSELERQLFVGTGGDTELTGLASVSGIQTHDASASLVDGARGAITKLENLGYSANVFVFSPVDWAAVELTRNSGDGAFTVDASPVDRAERKLWGTSVVTSTAVPAGKGYLFATDSAKLFQKGGVDLEWGTTADDFQRNQVRLRVETRVELAVTQPLGIIELATAAGA